MEACQWMPQPPARACWRPHDGRQRPVPTSGRMPHNTAWQYYSILRTCDASRCEENLPNLTTTSQLLIHRSSHDSSQRSCAARRHAPPPSEMRPTLCRHCRLHCLPRLRHQQHLHLPPVQVSGWPIRKYSVRVTGDANSSINTVADLRKWSPSADAPHVEVCGWVRSVRKSSAVRFVDVTDGSSMRPLQAVVDKSQSQDLRPGTAVRLRGTWCDAKRDLDPEAHVSKTPSPPSVARLGSRADRSPADTPTSGTSGSGTPTPAYELQVESVDILASSDPHTYPIQNKYQTPESLRAISHLRPRTPVNSTLLRLRSDAIAVLTRFFGLRNFQQTHPPIITSSDCEGAGEAFAVTAGGDADFFGAAKYLTVSSQLHLEALAQALGSVWALSPTFRAERSDTSRHLSEFYMLEAEMSFAQDMDQVMGLLQRMLAFLARELSRLSAAQELSNNRLDSREPAESQSLAQLAHPDELGRRWRGLLLEKPWPRITYTEALERLRAAGRQFEHDIVWGAGLQSEHERYLAREVGHDQDADAYAPVFITHFPRALKAFYMMRSETSPPQGETVDCFDLVVPDLGELAGGSMREHRLSQLQDNMRFRGLTVPSACGPDTDNLIWYLDLRRWGCPPHGGFGLGFDRLLSYLTGVANVRDVVPFPRHFGRCDC